MKWNNETMVTLMNTCKENLTRELEAWKKVTFNFKKDGTPFQNLKKCFNNAEYVIENGDYPRLRIMYNRKSYKEDCMKNEWTYINCYEYSYSKPNRYYSFEECKQAVSDYITELENKIKQIESDTEKITEITKEIDEAVDNLSNIFHKHVDGREKYSQGRTFIEMYTSEKIVEKIYTSYLRSETYYGLD